MNKNKATYAIVLFTKQPKKDKTFPLKLRITYERQQKYYGIGLSFGKDSWDKINNQNARGEYRDIKLKLHEIEKRARQVIEHFDETDNQFSFQRFEEIFLNQSNNTDYVFEALKVQIEDQKAKGKVSSAYSANNALKSFETFFKNRQIKFKDITPQVLTNYENWMLNEQQNSVSTVGIYLRSLKALFNRQIAGGLLDGALYPFGRYKYQIPTVETRDKVLSKDVLQQLYEYNSQPYSHEDRGKDLWFFLYLGNGMNVKDMCRLKYSNFREGYFLYSRAKTEGTNKQKKEITVIINDAILKIIEKWGNKYDSNNEQYIFPFYPPNVTPQDEYRITQNLTSVINDNMNRIAKSLELGVHITTYSARQTFSNVLLNSDAPIKLISDSLGHASSAVTEKHYLKRISIEKQKLFNNELLNFDNKKDEAKKEGI